MTNKQKLEKALEEYATEKKILKTASTQAWQHCTLLALLRIIELLEVELSA